MAASRKCRPLIAEGQGIKNNSSALSLWELIEIRCDRRKRVTFFISGRATISTSEDPRLGLSIGHNSCKPPPHEPSAGSATEKQKCGETAHGKTNDHERRRVKRLRSDLRELRRDGNCEQNSHQQNIFQPLPARAT